ncbi:lycopene cyclase family protein [Sandaracinus amylolyticus]|uniref:Lycopene beta cyclase n=1 Tax=Sandaracinus amylolyticus TaxID=927083 RepID=A0A0F6W5J6_9BACT|nr:lycopene cyclase family protein [Sandaracinus amylolyticus]AKF08031.1 Lycopene beta cyclase [Sandaracinus amylolyticus]
MGAARVTLDAEHVIVGAGCAGLSLAVRLAMRTPRERGRVLVIDPREELGGDRTWCMFRGAPHPFERAITHRWDRWRVIAGGRVIERSVPGRPYEHVDSTRFFEEAIARVETSEGVRLERGVRADAIVDEGAQVRIETGGGTLRARIAWDARGGGPDERPREDDVRWIQHFVGWVVRTERAIFEPGIATLMDFSVSQSRGPHFVYVLPYAANEALVEDTYFGDVPLAVAEYERGIREWLDAHHAGGVEIVRRERGQIPMSTAQITPRRDPRIVPIGLRAGSAKPSSGYAFAFIQRHVEALAARVDRGETVPPEVAVRSPITTFYDRVFLAYLRRHPTSAPEVFGSLFARTSPERLVRFLSEEGGVGDHLAVMNAVPRLAVMAEIARSRGLWMGR